MGSNVKETTGIDIAEDRAIEIAATHSPDDVRSPGGLPGARRFESHQEL